MLPHLTEAASFENSASDWSSIDPSAQSRDHFSQRLARHFVERRHDDLRQPLSSSDIFIPALFIRRFANLPSNRGSCQQNASTALSHTRRRTGIIDVIRNAGDTLAFFRELDQRVHGSQW